MAILLAIVAVYNLLWREVSTAPFDLVFVRPVVQAFLPTVTSTTIRRRRLLMLRSNLTGHRIDEVLVGTFPASDPPAWTPGIARPAPSVAERPAERDVPRPNSNDLHSDVIDVSRTDSERTFVQAIVSWIGAAGLGLLAGLAIVAVGAALVLGVRVIVSIGELVVGMIR